MNRNENEIKIGQQWMRNDTRAIKAVKDVSPAGMVLLLNGRMKNKICVSGENIYFIMMIVLS